jgi:hypothetical protein
MNLSGIHNDVITTDLKSMILEYRLLKYGKHNDKDLILSVIKFTTYNMILY